MIHHSATKDGQTVSWQAIRRYHMSWRHRGEIVTPQDAAKLMLAGERVERPWEDTGYHCGVELVNDHLEALLGRPENERAAACKEADMNARALHVCVVGNFDIAPPDDALLRFLARYVVRPWLVRYDIPAERIVGHRDYAPYKSCPGALFDLDRLREAC
jgi:hypothetical protein